MTLSQYKGLRSQSIITQLKNNNFNGETLSAAHDFNTLKVKEVVIPVIQASKINSENQQLKAQEKPHSRSAARKLTAVTFSNGKQVKQQDRNSIKMGNEHDAASMLSNTEFQNNPYQVNFLKQKSIAKSEHGVLSMISRPQTGSRPTSVTLDGNSSFRKTTC